MGTEVRIAVVGGAVGFGLLRGPVLPAEAQAVVTGLGQAWWGIAGLGGLLGLVGVLRLRKSARTRPSREAGHPFAKYPSANQPCVPNADAAHTPLMMPEITPEMVGRVPRKQAVPSGSAAPPVPLASGSPVRQAPPEETRSVAVPEHRAPEESVAVPPECAGTQRGTLFPGTAEQDGGGDPVSPGADDKDPERGAVTGSGTHRKRSRSERSLAGMAKRAVALPGAGLRRARGLLRRWEKREK
jgi:hypothetical protein